MPLRKDYILNRYSYISPKRAQRPHQYKKSLDKNHPQDCPFCPGKEAETPTEIGRINDKEGNWRIRWFKNKFPVLSLEKSPSLQVNSKYLISGPAYGTQEVIVETPDSRQMAEFSEQEISQILKVYSARIVELQRGEGIKYVLVFKNKGKEGGASIVHSHSQVMATGKLPEKINRELTAFSRYNHCPYCEVASKEEASPRLAFKNEHFVAFCPYAPRYNYEVWILPRKHKRTLAELGKREYQALSSILKKVLLKLAEINAPYCFYVQYAPPGNDFHFQIEILPRLNVHAGFELSGGDTVATVTPEQSAAFFRRRSFSNSPACGKAR